MYFFRGGEALIPPYDLFKMFSDPLKVMKDGLTPLLKMPAEQLLNVSAHTGRAITEVEGQPAKSRTLRNLGFNRRVENIFRTALRPGAILSDMVDRMTQENNGKGLAPGFMNGAIDLFLGKQIRNDPEVGLRVNAANYTRDRSTLTRLMNRYKKEGDKASARTMELLRLELDLRTPHGK